MLYYLRLICPWCGIMYREYVMENGSLRLFGGPALFLALASRLTGHNSTRLQMLK